MNRKGHLKNILQIHPVILVLISTLMGILIVLIVDANYGDDIQRIIHHNKIISFWSHKGDRIYIVYVPDNFGRKEIRDFGESLKQGFWGTTVVYFYDNKKLAPDLTPLEEIDNARKIHDYIWDSESGKYREHCIAEFWKFSWRPDQFIWHFEGLSE